MEGRRVRLEEEEGGRGMEGVVKGGVLHREGVVFSTAAADILSVVESVATDSGGSIGPVYV